MKVSNRAEQYLEKADKLYLRFLTNLSHIFFSDIKKLILIIFVINLCLIIDVAICTSPEFIQEQIMSPFGISTFILITSGSIFGQLYLQKFAEKDNKELLSKSKYLLRITKINKTTSYILIVNLVIVILSVIIFSKFSIINLLLANNISVVVGSYMLGSFGLKFFMWYLERRNSVIILLYGLGFIFFAFCNFIIFMSDNFLLIEKPVFITPYLPIIYPEVQDNIFGYIVKYWTYLQTLSFIMLLSASYILLSHYSERINRYKLIFILTLVFIIFMTSKLDSFNILDVSDDDKNLFFYYIFQSLINTVGGVIFGYSFWIVANKLEIDNPIRRYLIMTAIGFIIIYTVTQSTVIATAYPPYGLSSLSFIISSIYLVNFGLYSSAISLSHDVQLRNKIRTLTVNHKSLLGNIGQAQMTSELQKAITDVKDVVDKEEQELKEKTGIESTLTKENVENYMEQVLQEMMKSKNKSKS
ncbi:MAG: hypothetical protein ACXWFZ_09770 [Nitrososphaeraceae archaeon]